MRVRVGVGVGDVIGNSTNDLGRDVIGNSTQLPPLAWTSYVQRRIAKWAQMTEMTEKTGKDGKDG